MRVVYGYVGEVAAHPDTGGETAPIGATESAAKEPAGQRELPQLVSVVIPVRNGGAVLEGQLRALANQSYRGSFEVLIADNGSTDDTIAVAKRWTGLLRLRVIDASSLHGLSYARNQGMEAAEGNLFAFCDCDDEASPGWLAALVETSRRYDAVGGSLEFETLNQDVVQREGHIPPRRLLLCFGGFKAYGPGGNFCIRRDVVRAIGGWNERYWYGGEDVEYSFRIQQAGYSLGLAEEAVMHCRLRDDDRSLFRQRFRYGSSHVQLFADFRHSGLRRSSLLSAAKAWAWIITRLPVAMWKDRRRRQWIRIFAMRAGRLAASLRHRTIYL
jgi:glycosyltransferase involved in cell wall biosynthesis